MKMKTRYYILTAIFSYLFFTLGSVPADKLIALLETNNAMPIKLYGVYGSLWNGGAEQARIPGKPPLTHLQWSINPAALLLARISGEVKTSINQQNIIADLSINALGTIRASDIRARVDAKVVQNLLRLPMGELAGSFNINIESLQLQPPALPIIRGRIKWQNAKFTLMEPVKLGHIQLDISPLDNNGLKATINSAKGQLSIKGRASVDEKKQYKLELSLIPEDSASPNIRQSLGMFARRQTDGSYLLKRNGNLTEFGL